MANSFIQVPADGVGKQVDTSELNVGGVAAQRQRVVIGDNSATAGFATVTSGALMVTGNINISTMPAVTLAAGSVIDLSGTATVTGTIFIGAGTANIGSVNGISATVTVVGKVSLGAGTANIGTINDISATVTVVLVAGTANIGGVSLVAGTSNIGFINNISATVNAVLAAGGNNIGYINNISATVAVGLAYVFDSTQQTNQVHVGDSANSAIRVNIVAGAAAGGTSMADGTGFVAGTTAFTPSGGTMDDAAPGVVAEGSAGAVRITPYRAFHVNLRTASGSAMEDATNNALRVNIVAGGGTGGTAQNDGAAFVAQTTSYTPIGGYVDDTAPGVLAEGSAGAVRVTPNRAFHINLRDSAGAELGNTSATGLFIRTATIAIAAGSTINNISATVLVAGTVSLGAGTANIGDINAISRTVQVAIGTPFTVNNISATVSVVNGAGTANMGGVSLVAGTANIGFINNISATIAAVLAAGTANIGSINNISRTVVCGLSYVADFSQGTQVAVGDSANGAVRVNIVADAFVNSVVAIMSSSHGPKCVTASTSANVTLIASPGAGIFIYVTQIMCTNAGTVSTLARIGTSASISTLVGFIASAGGGFVLNLDPPYKLSASEAALCSVKPNASGNVYFTVNYYVGT